MIVLNPNQLVSNAMTEDELAIIIRILGKAYQHIEFLYKHVPVLQVVTAQYGKGHLIGWAADFFIEILLKNKRLPFSYSWESYSKPTGKFLQIELGTCTLSISQTQHICAVPRDAKFRTKRAINNETLLSFNDPEFDLKPEIDLQPHLILTHGYKKLNFCAIGLINTYSEWAYQTQNLIKAAHLEDIKLPPIEATDLDLGITLKDTVEATDLDLGITLKDTEEFIKHMVAKNVS